MLTIVRTSVLVLLFAPLLLTTPAAADGGVSLTGEVVDLACYMSHGATSPDAARCTATADAERPKGLLVYDGFLAVLAPASGLSSGTLENLPYERMEIEGSIVDRGGVTVLLAESFRRAPDGEGSAPRSDAAGTDSLADHDPLWVGDGVTAPVKIRHEVPEYPAEAKAVGLQGVVIVQVLIDREGTVRNAKVLKGLPLGVSEAAAAAVKQWKFEPATKNGEPVDVLYNLTINFRLS